MKKIGKGLAIFIITLFILFIVAKLTGIATQYKIATGANEPALKEGELIFTSNLKKARAGEFVTYTDVKIDSILLAIERVDRGGYHFIHRLVAVEGDIIEMKNGVLYLNKRNFDNELDIKNFYKVAKKDYNVLPSRLLEENENSSNYDLIQTDSVLYVNLTTKELKTTKFSIVPNLSNTSQSPDIFKWYGNNLSWTSNDFGPIKIPKGCGFVIGDNRDNSLDSRFWGFIELSNIKGVKL